MSKHLELEWLITDPVMTHHEKKQAFFKQANLLFALEPSQYSFAAIVRQRQSELLANFPKLANTNLDTLFNAETSITYIENHSLLFPLSPLALLERQAITIFGNILLCWAEYERWKITNKYDASPLKSSSQSLPLIEAQYHSEIIEHIETEQRLFHTLHCDKPLLLSDAIALINIDVFIIEQSWYEMLFSLELSQNNCHYILYHLDEHKQKTIVSTVLLQNWEQNETWLSFDAFFNSPDWQNCLSHNAGQHLYRSGAFNHKVLEHFDCETAQNCAKYLCDPSAIVEALRLTISGPRKLRYFLLFLSQKHVVSQMYHFGKQVTFTIIELPIMFELYRALDDVCYLNRTCRDINQDGCITYKGFWLNEPLYHQLKDCSYRQYKALLSASRKAKQETSLV